MKKILTLSFLILSFTTILAQAPPPPNDNGSAPTSGDNTPVGGTAPIGSGMVILLGVAAAYAGKKAYNMQREKSE
jgi:hypothetical protein